MERSVLSKDVVIVGSGPAGLSAALNLGRGRKKVLVCDAGPRRNAAAEHMHGFVSRDGISPAEFRAIGREQLARYDVELRDVRVASVERHEGVFHLTLEDGTRVVARRMLLATGLVDQPLDLPGFRELWGKALFQCPYCHGWEIQDRAWGIVASGEHSLEFALFVKGWSSDLVLFTNGALELSAEHRERLRRAEIRVVESRVRRLGVSASDPEALEAVELEDGTRVAREFLFIHPPQKQVSLVESLVQTMGLALDEMGFVRVDAFQQTSVPGLYAAGDLTTRLQGALVAAAAGAMSAYRMNHELNMEALGASHG
ncbi:NAD(P)/FAD-dependent oxidoreductase [Myxococcus sp. K15C18031901]|uniref:NAD(P)/FAD-dependent oxidoreductase n=1 Tax=Myxococcus dinghuensis TaxID=2906761 RepID=UPI0020A7B127|nr:NAD(P)/FAD-dependent oxidoreductase [Myxococcus dinghuensis]MCP3104117.1 NAD(P)/FAD-dependent oxidoreductase [Myxococcus dinghuensis]